MCTEIDINVVLTVLNLVVTTISLVVVVGIYKQWEVQKRKEVLADEASMLIDKIIELRAAVIHFRTIKDPEYEKTGREKIGDGRDLIESYLNIISSTVKEFSSTGLYKDLVQTNRDYTVSTTEMIRFLNGSHVDGNHKYQMFLNSTKQLIRLLTKIKFYRYDDCI